MVVRRSNIPTPRSAHHESEDIPSGWSVESAAAAELLTGMPSRVGGDVLQIRFGDQRGLEELVQALESVAATLVDERAA